MKLLSATICALSLVSFSSAFPTSTKKGLGYNTASYTNAFQNSLSWSYDWANNPATSTGKLNSGVEFTPMLWGGNADGWSTAAQAAINAGAKHLLGFNEPDNGGQSNLTPAQAVTLWKQYMQPFAGKVKLISPAVTNGPNGITWMQQFLQQCTGCTVDAIAMHWYDSATNWCYFTGYFTDASNTFAGKPLWITEWAGSGTVAQQQTFFNYIIPWMESQSFIERYAAFGDFSGTFVNSDGSLTALGTSYANVAQPPSGWNPSCSQPH